MKKINLKNWVLFLATLIVMTLLFSCKCDSETLVNNKWVLEQYGPISNPNDILDPSQDIPPGKDEILLSFPEANRFQGNDGCNLIGGVYRKGDWCRIEFDSINTTIMMCGPEIMKQSGAIHALFEKVNCFKIVDSRLDLYTPDKEVLIYRKKKEPG